MSHDNFPQQDDATEDFLRYLPQNSREIYRCILGLVINRDIADDIYQETNLVLWREFAEFEKNTNFLAWSRRIAVNQVLAWRKRVQRSRLVFSEQFLQLVANETDKNDDLLKRRRDALTHCLTKLPSHHREMIESRYLKQLTIEEISILANRTIDAVYRTLSRIRQTLHECVTKRITKS